MNHGKTSNSCMEKIREVHIKSNDMVIESLKTNGRKENDIVRNNSGLCSEKIKAIYVISNRAEVGSF